MMCAVKIMTDFVNDLKINVCGHRSWFELFSNFRNGTHFKWSNYEITVWLRVRALARARMQQPDINLELIGYDMSLSLNASCIVARNKCVCKLLLTIPFNWTMRHSCGENLETINSTMLTPTYANITHICTQRTKTNTIEFIN